MLLNCSAFSSRVYPYLPREGLKINLCICNLINFSIDEMHFYVKRPLFPCHCEKGMEPQWNERRGNLVTTLHSRSRQPELRFTRLRDF